MPVMTFVLSRSTRKPREAAVWTPSTKGSWHPSCWDVVESHAVSIEVHVSFVEQLASTSLYDFKK
jgi:hypothetical protein